MFSTISNFIRSHSPMKMVDPTQEVENFYNLYRFYQFDRDVFERLAKVYNRCYSHLNVFEYLTQKNPIFFKRLMEYVIDGQWEIVDWNLKDKDPLSSDLFKWAMKQNHLGVCRWLIDQGCPIPVEVRDWIEKKFQQLPMGHTKLPLFFLRRPKVGVIEIFDPAQDHFSPVKAEQVRNNKPIALIHIATHDLVNKLSNYGANTAFLSSKKNIWNAIDFYQQIANRFTVLRVLVSDKQQFIPILEKVEGLFRNKKMNMAWILATHGNDKLIALREGVFDPEKAAYLQEYDYIFMQEIAKRLGQASIIALLGCSNAQGEENIAKVFSKHSQGIPVAGCSGDACVREVYIWEGQSPVLLPKFFDFPTDPPPGLVVYKNGEKILDEQQEIRSKL